MAGKTPKKSAKVGNKVAANTDLWFDPRYFSFNSKAYRVVDNKLDNNLANGFWGG
jgi:hypothetical protein